MTPERKYRFVKTKLGLRVKLLIGKVQRRIVTPFLTVKSKYLLSKLR